MLRVLTSVQAAAVDSASIRSGNPSRALMQRAGAAAAAEICNRLGPLLRDGVLAFAGPGNNGGDAWVVAAALAAVGVRVSVRALPARTADATAERERALAGTAAADAPAGERVVIDGLLGTGAAGALRTPVLELADEIRRMRADGATVVALDLPSGLDASTGESLNGISADLTLTFGTLKRGHVLNRQMCGTTVVLDIGLGSAIDAAPGAPLLLTPQWVLSRIPRIPADAHKGTRRRLAIVGGSEGMFGAAALAAEGAARAGIGLARLVLAHGSMPAAQASAHHAIAATWPQSSSDAGTLLSDWAHAVVIGPGLGTQQRSRDVLQLVTAHYAGPLVVDADALNLFSGDLDGIRAVAQERPTVLTPHANELSRLTGRAVEDVLASRFELVPEVAARTGAVVLFKGVPTVIAAPDGRVHVSASGSPVLAAGGSGDILAGMLGTLLAQLHDPFEAASCAAWVHGRAGEVASDGTHVRGRTLADVLEALPRVWAERPDAAPIRYPVLGELPAVGE